MLEILSSDALSEKSAVTKTTEAVEKAKKIGFSNSSGDFLDA